MKAIDYHYTIKHTGSLNKTPEYYSNLQAYFIHKRGTSFGLNIYIDIQTSKKLKQMEGTSFKILFIYILIYSFICQFLLLFLESLIFLILARYGKWQINLYTSN